MGCRLAAGQGAIEASPLFGEGYSLAILDTGIRKTHGLLAGHVVHERNFTSSPTCDDVFDHGTAVASIALAVAPKAGIVNLKVLNDDGTGTEESACEAIAYCLALHHQGSPYAPVVVNMSFGAPDTGDPNNALRVACRAVINAGIWVGASAGNEGPTPGTIMSPACERYVGCVGSCSYEPFRVSTFSSRGPTKEGLIKPDLLFFGEDIEVASSKSDSATVAKGGTSFSLPFISALALLFHEGYSRGAVPTQAIPGVHPELGRWIGLPEMLDRFLPHLAVKPAGSPTSKDNDYGWGLPFGPLAVQAVKLASVQPVFEVINAVVAPMLVMGMLAALASRR